jgi:hypothetical protein
MMDGVTNVLSGLPCDRSASFFGKSDKLLGAAICGVALLLAANEQGAFALPWRQRSWTLQGSGERKPAPDTSSVPAPARDDLFRGTFVPTGPASKRALVVADETQVGLNRHSLLQVKSVAAADEALADLSRSTRCVQPACPVRTFYFGANS